MKRIVLLAVAAVTLSACNNGGGIPGLGGGVSPPTRKPGLWQQTINNGSGPPRVTSLCVDASTDQRAPVLGRQFRRGTCSKYSITRGADGSYVSDSECQTDDGGVTVTNHTVATGDFQANYSVVSDVTREGCVDPSRDGEYKTTITAVYKGDCPANMKPGQIMLADGRIMDFGQRRGGGQGRGGGGRFGGGGCFGPGDAPGGNSAAPGGNSAAPGGNAAPASNAAG